MRRNGHLIGASVTTLKFLLLIGPSLCATVWVLNNPACLDHSCRNQKGSIFSFVHSLDFEDEHEDSRTCCQFSEYKYKILCHKVLSPRLLNRDKS